MSVIARFIALGVCLFSIQSWALPNVFVQEGLLSDGQNRPLNGNYTINLKLYDALEAGAVLFEETHAGVAVINGYYAVEVGSETVLPLDIFEREAVYLGMSIDGGRELVPRTAVNYVPAAMIARNALNVTGDITPSSVAVGGNLVIDAQGRWVGAPTGLQGPKGDDGQDGRNGADGAPGPVGPQGPQGERGPAGVAGGDGSPDTPEQVLAKLLEVDGAGSGLIADSVDGLEGSQFMRSDTDTGTVGNVDIAGKMTSASVETTQAKISKARHQVALQTLGDIKLTDNDIIGVQKFQINDPGPDGRIVWGGTKAAIFVSPLLGDNTDGYLRLQNDGGISLESDVRTTNDAAIAGRLAVGAETGTSKLFVQDDSAVSTGATIRNYRDGANSQPFLRLEGITPRAQGAHGTIKLRTGAEAGGSDTRNEGALEFIVSTGGAGADRSAMMIQHNGEIGVGVANPLGKFHVANVDARSKPSIISGSVPGLYLHDTEKSNGAIRYASFMIEADGSKLYIGSRSKETAGTPGSGSRSVTIQENGYMGLNTRSPRERLEVNGNAYIDGNLTVTGELLGPDGQPLAGAGGTSLPTGNLAVYLNFNAGEGDQIVDNSGSQNHFSFANGATWTGDGLRGNAVKFDGTDDYIYRNATGWNGYFTISMWVKTAEARGYWTSESNPGPGGCWRYWGDFSGGKANFSFWDNSNPAETRNRRINGVSNVTDGKWHHLAVTLNKDDDSMRLYVDGVQEDSIATEGNERSYSRRWIGGVHGGCLGNQVMNGSVDDYRFYHRALTGEEIRTLYEAANDVQAIYVRPDGNVGVGTEVPESELDVDGVVTSDGVNTGLVTAKKGKFGEVEIGEVSTATAGIVSANATQAREREIANFTLNDHHWSSTAGFFIEAYARSYDSGYRKYYIDTGYRSLAVRKVETMGDLASRFGIRVVKGARVADRGGHPEYRYHVYAQAAYYTNWSVTVTTGSMQMITEGDASSDGVVAVKETSGHANVASLENSAYETYIRGDLEVTGDLKAEELNVDELNTDALNTKAVSTDKLSNGSIHEAAAGRVSASATQSREREIANFTLNDHHWSSSNGFFVEAFSTYYDSGFVKYYIDTGYRSLTVRKLETHGDLGTRFGLRVVKGAQVGVRGGHPEWRYHVYGQASYYSQWNVIVRTGSMNLVTTGDANGDGTVAVKASTGHRNVGSLSNNSYESNIRGDLKVSGNLTVNGKDVSNGRGSPRDVARSICYSALTGNRNHSIIMVPLPSHNSNLDGVCHSRINGGWHAGGVAKGNYFYQNCPGDINNTSYGGGYTSYTEEGYFESRRGNFTNCNSSNAFICCSPQFPN